MEVLGATASVAALVDLSVKVTSLLVQYSKDVRRATADIERIKSELTELKSAWDNVKKLLDGPNGKRLAASQNFAIALEDSRSRLEDLEKTLDPGTGRSALRKLGVRLKWPLDKKDVGKTIQDLASCTQMISLGLLVDQAYVPPSLDV